MGITSVVLWDLSFLPFFLLPPTLFPPATTFSFHLFLIADPISNPRSLIHLPKSTSTHSTASHSTSLRTAHSDSFRTFIQCLCRTKQSPQSCIALSSMTMVLLESLPRYVSFPAIVPSLTSSVSPHIGFRSLDPDHGLVLQYYRLPPPDSPYILRFKVIAGSLASNQGSVWTNYPPEG
jgi:hypothetical protein